MDDGWDFFPNWPATLGDEPPEGRCLGGIQAYRIDPQAASSGAAFLSPDDWKKYEAALGWIPASELAIGIYCNRERDHQILAWLCAEDV